MRHPLHPLPLRNPLRNPFRLRNPLRQPAGTLLRNLLWNALQNLLQNPKFEDPIASLFLSLCEQQSSVTGQTHIQHPTWALGICAHFVWPSSVGQAIQQSLPGPLETRVWGQSGKGSTLSWRHELCSHTNAGTKFWQTLSRSSVCCRANSTAQYHGRPSLPSTRADGEEIRQDLDLSNCDGCEGNVASLTKASLACYVTCVADQGSAATAPKGTAIASGTYFRCVSYLRPIMTTPIA